MHTGQRSGPVIQPVTVYSSASFEQPSVANVPVMKLANYQPPVTKSLQPVSIFSPCKDKHLQANCTNYKKRFESVHNERLQHDSGPCHGNVKDVFIWKKMSWHCLLFVPPPIPQPPPPKPSISGINTLHRAVSPSLFRVSCLWLQSGGRGGAVGGLLIKEEPAAVCSQHRKYLTLESREIKAFKPTLGERLNYYFTSNWMLPLKKKEKKKRKP